MAATRSDRESILALMSLSLHAAAEAIVPDMTPLLASGQRSALGTRLRATKICVADSTRFSFELVATPDTLHELRDRAGCQEKAAAVHAELPVFRMIVCDKACMFAASAQQ